MTLLLCTLHSVFFTVHFALYTLRCILCAVHFALYTLRCTLYTIYSALYFRTVYVALYTLHYSLRSICNIVVNAYMQIWSSAYADGT